MTNPLPAPAPTPPTPPEPRWVKIGETHEVGKTKVLARCACHTVVVGYAWSWAGHGKKRCPGCGSWLNWGTTHSITPSDKLRAQLAAAPVPAP